MDMYPQTLRETVERVREIVRHNPANDTLSTNLRLYTMSETLAPSFVRQCYEGFYHGGTNLDGSRRGERQ